VLALVIVASGRSGRGAGGGAVLVIGVRVAAWRPGTHTAGTDTAVIATPATRYSTMRSASAIWVPRAAKNEMWDADDRQCDHSTAALTSVDPPRRCRADASDLGASANI